MQRLTIRRFDVIRTANVVAAIYAVIFGIIGLIFLPFVLIGAAAGAGNGGGAAAAGLIGALIVYLVVIAFYAVIGWVVTVIACAIYNVVAGRLGGIRIVVDVESPSGPYPGYPAPYPSPATAPGPSWPGGAPPAPPA